MGWRSLPVWFQRYIREKLIVELESVKQLSATQLNSVTQPNPNLAARQIARALGKDMNVLTAKEIRSALKNVMNF